MLCKICKSPTNKTTTLSNGKLFHHCENCFFSFVDDKFLPDADSEKARYDLHQNSIEEEGYVQIFQNFIKECISPFVNQDAQLLDYGCGPDAVLAELIKRDGFENIETYDPFYDEKKLDKKYDLICSTEVFEHFHQPLIEIEKILELLKHNGFLAIMTRFNPGIDAFKSWFYKNDFTHVSFYAQESFAYLCQNYKLEQKFSNKVNTICLQKTD